jgi:hypothetical protein
VCTDKTTTRFPLLWMLSNPLQVTADGTVYVGHQDMTVKKFLPLDSAVNSGAADSQPTTPRRTNGSAAVQVHAVIWCFASLLLTLCCGV